MIRLIRKKGKQVKPQENNGKHVNFISSSTLPLHHGIGLNISRPHRVCKLETYEDPKNDDWHLRRVGLAFICLSLYKLDRIGS